MLEVIKAFDEVEKKNYIPPQEIKINVKEETMKENMKMFMRMIIL